MNNAIYIVDAFTDTEFTGNPAGVCILSKDVDASWMQSVAAEMNQPETAFLTPSSGENVYSLRWFSPQEEIPLCGHATLASAHVLWSSEAVEYGSTIKFNTLSGELTAKRNDDWIELNFPASEAFAIAPPMELTVALGATPVYVGREVRKVLCELSSEEEVRQLTPDFRSLAALPGVEGVIVTSRADFGEPYDFVSRFFAPAVGIDEDPVTGSSHCVLAPYWSARLGKTELTGFQASKRGGVVRVNVLGYRVLLVGQAVMILSGELCV